MELLPKIGIYIGIFIGITCFTLFVLAVFPHVVENSARDWERISPSLTQEEMLEKLRAQESYKAFYEKYPDAKEIYEPRRNSGDLSVSIGNFEKYNVLRLEISYDIDDDFIREWIRCETQNETLRDLTAQGPIVIDFIKESNCLDIEPSAPIYEYQDLEVPQGIIIDDWHG